MQALYFQYLYLKTIRRRFVYSNRALDGRQGCRTRQDSITGVLITPPKATRPDPGTLARGPASPEFTPPMSMTATGRNPTRESHVHAG